MKSYDHITEIDRRSGISQKEFYHQYVKHSLPVVLTDKGDWVNSEKFTEKYFKTNYNHITKKVDGKAYSLSEIIDLCKSSTPEHKAPYPNIYNVKKEMPEYLDVIPALYYGKSNRLQSSLLAKIFARRTNSQELFFGGYGCSFPTLHIDYLGVHTQLTQVIGEKDFILYSPDQTPYLYPDKVRRNHSPIDITNPDYSKYPLFKKTKALKITLHPAETIFIPAGWWHTTYIHNFNLTYAIDHVNAFNWNTFMNEIYISTKNLYPKLSWTIKVYQWVMGHVFNIKELFLNKAY